MQDVWYFGCHRDSGHYLFSMCSDACTTKNDRRMGFPTYLLDGVFAPPIKKDGLWRHIVINGASGPLTIIAGWDNSIDDRPGSNAAFIAHGNLSLEEIKRRAAHRFPEQYKRIFESNRNIQWC